MKRFAFLLLLLMTSLASFAAESNGVDMADAMYKEGRIYVVIGVITIVFAGLAIYLFTIDRRLKKIERTKQG